MMSEEEEEEDGDYDDYDDNYNNNYNNNHNDKNHSFILWHYFFYLFPVFCWHHRCPPSPKKSTLPPQQPQRYSFLLGNPPLIFDCQSFH